jgi:hypothetical protein
MATKQLIIITAPFNCPHCTRAMDELPPICEENNWELIEMKNTRSEDDFPVETYPTMMIRVDDEVKETMKGYNLNGLKPKLLTY